MHDRNKNDRWVVACIPYYRGRRFIRRAVLSLLDQTHRELTIVVVNDGDFESPPWPMLSDIHDKRLIRFDLSRNHGGPFFANSVVVNASGAGYFLMQEQDDWSEPDRLKILYQKLQETPSDAVVSSQHFHFEDRNGNHQYQGLRWNNEVNTACAPCDKNRRCLRCFVNTSLSKEFLYRAPHAGLFRMSTLKSMGGYYAGLRMHQDTLLMNLILMVGQIAKTPLALYHRSMREDSLTQAASRGPLLGTSKSDYNRAKFLYQKSFEQYNFYLTGRVSGRSLVEFIFNQCEQQIPAEEKADLKEESIRLTRMLKATVED